MDPTPKPPNELLGPRSDSNIRLVLESIDYVDNSTWFETCCCTDKGDISYTPTRNAIFDVVVDKATAREKINIISCSMGWEQLSDRAPSAGAAAAREGLAS